MIFKQVLVDGTVSDFLTSQQILVFVKHDTFLLKTGLDTIWIPGL